MFTVGQILILTNDTSEHIGHSCKAYCARVSFRRLDMFGNAEVMTCRGSRLVSVSDLIAA